jgi:hypothetical protein
VITFPQRGGPASDRGTTEITDTHRRAALRGRESVAKWRIESGVWAGRLYAVFYGVVAIVPLLSGERRNWIAAAAIMLLAVAVFFTTEEMRRGSRVAACVLLGMFVSAKLSSWLVQGQPLWSGALWTILFLGALGSGVWGTFALAAVRRDALLVPPAPPRKV